MQVHRYKHTLLFNWETEIKRVSQYVALRFSEYSVLVGFSEALVPCAPTF